MNANVNGILKALLPKNAAVAKVEYSAGSHKLILGDCVNDDDEAKQHSLAILENWEKKINSSGMQWVVDACFEQKPRYISIVTKQHAASSVAKDVAAASVCNMQQEPERVASGQLDLLDLRVPPSVIINNNNLLQNAAQKRNNAGFRITQPQCHGLLPTLSSAATATSHSSPIKKSFFKPQPQVQSFQSPPQPRNSSSSHNNVKPSTKPSPAKRRRGCPINNNSKSAKSFAELDTANPSVPITKEAFASYVQEARRLKCGPGGLMTQFKIGFILARDIYDVARRKKLNPKPVLIIQPTDDHVATAAPTDHRPSVNVAQATTLNIISSVSALKNLHAPLSSNAADEFEEAAAATSMNAVLIESSSMVIEIDQQHQQQPDGFEHGDELAAADADVDVSSDIEILEDDMNTWPPRNMQSKKKSVSIASNLPVYAAAKVKQEPVDQGFHLTFEQRLGAVKTYLNPNVTQNARTRQAAARCLPVTPQMLAERVDMSARDLYYFVQKHLPTYMPSSWRVPR